MTSKTFELTQKMDIKAIETQMALRCAPLILGLKTSNLLSVSDEQAIRVPQLLQHSQMKSYLLFQGKQNVQKDAKAVFLLYRLKPLCNHLADRSVQELLLQFGYCDFSMDGLLTRFASRYAACMCNKAQFPHEMGIFLGYPTEDVCGFIENKGKKFLCAGYWKVYANAAQKRRLFQYFDRASELLVKLLAQGVRIEDVLACA